MDNYIIEFNRNIVNSLRNAQQGQATTSTTSGFDFENFKSNQNSESQNLKLSSESSNSKMVFIQPHIGGSLQTGSTDASKITMIAFSGGGLHNKPKTAKTTFCYCPNHTDLKNQQSIEKAYTTPLEEAFCLDMNPAKKGPMFIAWLNDVNHPQWDKLWKNLP